MEEKTKERVFRHPKLVEKMAKGNFEFVMELYQKCVGVTAANTLLSPFGISGALVMIFVGARKESQRQIRKIMRLDQVGSTRDIQKACEDVVDSGKEQIGLRLLIANGLYLHNEMDILPDYKELLQTKFNAAVHSVDFVEDSDKVRIDINNYVAGVTNNRVKNFLVSENITPQTRLVLINVVYFKGDWLNKFDGKLTSKQPFRTSEKDTKMVNMMLNTGLFCYAESDDMQCSMLELPYVGERVGMYILLPKDVSGLSGLEKKMTHQAFSQLLKSSKLQEITVSLPRFKIESVFSFGDMLKGIGIQEIFVPGLADLSGVTTTGPLHVSALFHKAVLEVNEDGSEASDSRPSNVGLHKDVPCRFVADHSFLVMIRDNYSGLLLFAGTVVNPMDTT